MTHAKWWDFALAAVVSTKVSGLGLTVREGRKLRLAVDTFSAEAHCRRSFSCWGITSGQVRGLPGALTSVLTNLQHIPNPSLLEVLSSLADVLC